MSGDAIRAGSTAAALRGAFDGAFAAACRAAAAPDENLLAIRVGGEPYAIRLAQIAGLFADRVVTPLPGSPAGLLGLAGFRGALVPVYDLGALLGGTSQALPRWLVLATAPTQVALAFDGFDGHLRLPRTALTVDERANAAHGHVRELARGTDGTRAVLHLPAILASITTRAANGAPHPGEPT